MVKKIILTRPAVEAGKALGSARRPQRKRSTHTYVHLYDALDDMIPADKLGYHMSTRMSNAPLAYMRGRTLDNALSSG